MKNPILWAVVALTVFAASPSYALPTFQFRYLPFEPYCMSPEYYPDPELTHIKCNELSTASPAGTCLTSGGMLALGPHNVCILRNAKSDARFPFTASKDELRTISKCTKLHEGVTWVGKVLSCAPLSGPVSAYVIRGVPLDAGPMPTSPNTRIGVPPTDTGPTFPDPDESCRAKGDHSCVPDHGRMPHSDIPGRDEKSR